MSALDDFINSLSEEEKRILKEDDIAHRSETDTDQEYATKEA